MGLGYSEVSIQTGDVTKDPPFMTRRHCFTATVFWLHLWYACSQFPSFLLSVLVAHLTTARYPQPVFYPEVGARCVNVFCWCKVCTCVLLVQDV
jgi:hypothetical protein